MLSFEQVSYAYPRSKAKALDKLSFTLEKGQRIALLGFNGSGKSTLARLANGLLIPRSGKVSLGEIDTSQQNMILDFRKQVGVVAQDPDNQILASTVLDDVAFGLENLGLHPHEIEMRAKRALSTMGLLGYEERDPNTLSGGEKQRLVIAGILAMKPDYLVFDEPSSMLDALGRKEVLEAIEELHTQGQGILHITHDLEEALAADRVIVLEKGCIVFEGTPVQLMADNEIRQAFEANFSPFLRLGDHLEKAGIGAPTKRACVDDWVKAVHESSKLADVSELNNMDDVAIGHSVDHQKQKTTSPEKMSGRSLHLQSVSYSYAKGSPQQREALHEVDLEVEPGSYTLVLGRSGSGKSTLLNMAAGLLTPDEGIAHFRFPQTSSLSGTLGKSIEPGSVGIVFQQPESQLFASTIFDDVVFGAKNIGVSTDEGELEEIARKALEAVDLDYQQFRDRSPFSLSGGEARRVAIASILAMQPRFMLFDEPSAGLDFKGRAFLHRLIENLLAQGVGIVVVSHDLDEFLPRAHTALILENAYVAWKGSTKQLIADPYPLENAGLHLPPILAFQKQLAAPRGFYSYDPQIIVSQIRRGRATRSPMVASPDKTSGSTHPYADEAPEEPSSQMDGGE